MVIVPNLLIPIGQLFPGMELPTLLQLPPERPWGSLQGMPPPFRMATEQELDDEEEQLITFLTEQGII